jgi:hypothetical protein
MEYEKLTEPLGRREIDITGKTFGHLTAIYPTTSKYYRSRIWFFECECGEGVWRDAHTVMRGHTTSCGCIGKSNRLLNCKENRTCCVEGTNLGNLINPVLKKNNTSGYNGVHRVQYKTGDRWIAQIMFKRRGYYLGSYTTLEEALLARQEAEKLLFDPTIAKHFDNLSDHLKKDFFKNQLQNTKSI